MAAVFPDISMNTFHTAPDQIATKNSTSDKLSTTSKMNAFWVCLLIFTQLVAVAFATDWAIITLFNLPFALTVVLAIITAAGVVYGGWFAVRAAINSEHEFNGQV
jgi:K+-sensing histidine kinase KdpD